MRDAFRWVLAGGLLLLSLPASPSFAQGRVGIGAQAGDVTGLALKLGPTGRAWDFAAAWDFDDDSFVLQAHLLLDQPVLDRSASGRFQWYYGPGGVLAVQSRRDDEEVRAGLSFNVGLAFFPAPAFELFGQVTPRLLVVPSSDFDLGAAVGVRFYP